MRRVSFLRGALVVTALALIASACGGGGPPTATSQPTAAVQPTTASQPTATSRPTATPVPPPTATPLPVPTGQLRFAVSTLRQQTMIASLGVLAFNIDPMYDYMIGANAKGELENSHGVATSWAMSADGKTWIFKFRSGVVFHNGDPLTSQDALHSLDTIRNAKTATSVGTRLKATVETWDTPDNSTMLINLKARDIFFATTTVSALTSESGFVYPKNYLSRLGEVEFSKQPIGSGPYKFKDNLIGDRIVYEALDKHWYYGIPKFKTFSFIAIPEESTRLALLRTGDIELTDVSRAGAKQAAQAGMRIKERTGGQTLHMRLHDQWADGNPLKNPLVRKALDISINRQVVVDTFLGGGGTPAIQHVPRPGDPAFVPVPVPPQDIAKAKQLLKEAGQEGFTLNLVIHETVGVPEGQEIAEAIAVWWEQAGIKVKRSNLAYATVLDKWTKHTFDMPTVTCCPTRVNSSMDLNPVTPIQDGFIYRVGYAPDLIALGLRVPQSSSIEEYIQLSREFGLKFTELSLMPTIAYVGQLYALRPAIGGENWDLGKASSGIRVLELVRR